MNFYYAASNNKSENLNIEIGNKWNQIGKSNSYLNTIFSKIDNGDGIVQENEYLLLNKILQIADSLGKTDKNLSLDELKNLINKINNKELNIENLKTESITQINPEEYSLEALKKRYPETKFEIKIRQQSYEIIDKQTNKKVLNVDCDKNGFYVTDYDKNGKEVLFRNYSNSGALNFYDKKNEARKYPIAEYINQDVCAKNRFGLPTTGKDIEKHVKMLDSKNIIMILDEYKNMYGEDMVDAINNEWGLDEKVKNRLLNHIQKCLEENYGYKNNFTNNNSQVVNKWHKGDSYSIVNKNDVITIKNKKTGKIRTIDLNKLVDDLDLRSKAAVKAQISCLPGEILMDLAVEGIDLKKTNFLEKLMIHKNVAACYSPGTNNITVGFSKDEYDISTHLVHELGHAVDFKKDIINRSTAENNELFTKTFQKELENFKQTKGKVHDWSDESMFGNTYIRKEGGRNISNYASENENECFAEIYTLLTTGECNSQEMLEDFFPETIRVAEKILNEIRNLPDNVRASSIV